jgi:hypothetical protein
VDRAGLRWAPRRATARALPASALATLALTALALGGCGAARAPRPGPTLTLALTAPADGSRVSAATTTVSGSVHPARRTRVEVLGRAVPVARDGHFSAAVELAVGTNLIDVIALAPRSAGAVTAVRVVRFLLVTVPPVAGLSPTQAASALRALGLAVRTDGSSDPLNFLIPASTRVCYSTPEAGARVNPGATVTIKTSRFCGL